MKATMMAVVLAAMMVALGCEPVDDVGDDDDNSGEESGTTAYEDCVDLFMQGVQEGSECNGEEWNDAAKEVALDYYEDTCSLCDDSEKGNYHDDAVACGKSTEWTFDDETQECDASMSEELCAGPLEGWLMSCFANG